MRTLNLLLLPLLLLNQAKAQINEGNYDIISTGYETWFPRRLPVNISTSFLYTVTDNAIGGVTTQTFTGATNRQFSRTVSVADLFDLEFLRKDFAFDIGAGVNTTLQNGIGLCLKLGYRYVIPFGHIMRLEPGIDIYYVSDGGAKLGTIDNKDKDINLFGYTAWDNWTATDDDNNTNTYAADHMDVIYRRRGLLAAPKIIVATRPIGKFCFSVEAGWMLQLKQFSLLDFVQEDGSGNSNDVGKISLPNNGYMGGPYAGINVGFAFVPRQFSGQQQ